MNFRQMQYFVAVYEEGGFSRAAAREHCTQSGLSQQIRNLEERLGLTLFECTPHGAQPTLAGAQSYRHCVPILRAAHAAEHAMGELRGSLSGRSEGRRVGKEGVSTGRSRWLTAH